MIPRICVFNFLAQIRILKIGTSKFATGQLSIQTAESSILVRAELWQSAVVPSVK